MLTTAQVATTLAVSPSTVNRLAAAHGIGSMHGAARSFAPGDLGKLRRAMANRPKPSSEEMRRRVMVRWSRKIS